jgi:hypothetical protein
MAATTSSDKSLGLGVLFGALGLVGALGMLFTSLNHDQLGSGIAFGAAMLAGAVAVAVVHIYG